MESIGCAKEGGTLPIEEAAAKFNEECSPSECPQYFICQKLSKQGKEEHGDQNNN